MTFSMKKAIEKTKYRERADHLTALLKNAGVTKAEHLPNAVGRIGHHAGGVDMFDLVAEINKTMDADDVPTAPPAALTADPVTEKSVSGKEIARQKAAATQPAGDKKP